MGLNIFHRGEPMSTPEHHGIEDLLFATLDAVSRFRVGQQEAVSAALEAGALLTEAKGRLRMQLRVHTDGVCRRELVSILIRP